MKTNAKAVVLSLAVFAGCASRVVDYLPDQQCGNAATLIADGEGVRNTAVCADEGSTRVIYISTENRRPPEDGRLLAFSLGFCGSEVAGVEAPQGWTAEVHGPPRSFSIEWRVRDRAADQGILAGQKLGGFVVRLGRGWRRTGFSSAQWEERLVGTTVTHDACAPARGNRLTSSWSGRH